MRDIDYEFIARNMASLSCIAIRVYRNGQQIIYEDPSHFPVDPATNVIDTLLSIDRPVSYYISEYEHFYGVVNYGDTTLIVGPTFQMAPSREKIREFMFSLNIKENYLEHYQALLDIITPMPLELFLHELCLVYYFVSEEKIDLPEVAIYDSYQSIQKQGEANSADETVPVRDREDFHEYQSDMYSTADFEKEMLSHIKNGDEEGLLTLFQSRSAGRSGKMASNYLRQLKNIFVATATLVSRAAIEGGLPTAEALQRCDSYIQHAESYSDPEQIMNLQYHMVLDYTHLVAGITGGRNNDRFIRSVSSYVQNHLTEEISIEEMAEALGYSRSYLSAKFKDELGKSLNTYITEQRINKAKQLLKSTDRSILEISTYLGFSSQGYFQNVFKKITGTTPRRYREE